MGRSGYSDDYADEDPLGAGRWRAAVRSSMGGRRGQAFLRELVGALDALPVKELVANNFVTRGGSCCSFGSVALSRGMDVSALEPVEKDGYRIEPETAAVAAAFGIANAMACELMFMNDEVCGWAPPAGPMHAVVPTEKPERARWRQMRAWVQSQIRTDRLEHGSA